MNPSAPHLKIRFFHFALPIVWTLCIFGFSTDILSARRTGPATHSILVHLLPFLTEAELETAHILIRKLGHVSEYALLALLWRHAWMHGAGASRSRALILAVVLSVGYAALDEWHQTFTRERQGSIADVAVDSIGVCLATGIALQRDAIARKRRRARRD
jgi:VanZ family protein